MHPRLFQPRPIQETPSIDSRYTRILIVRAGALGDTLLTLPAIASLRELHPGVHITVAGYPYIWKVAGDLVDTCLSIEAPSCIGLLGGVPTAESLDLVRDHDLTVMWSTRTPHPALAKSGARIIHASPYPPPGVHAATWLTDTLGLPCDLLSPMLLALTPRENAAAIEVLRDHGLSRPVVLHPGAGAHWKRWPAERFAQVATALVAQGKEVALLAGPADEETVTAVTSHLDHPLPVIRDVSLRTLAAVLAASAAYLGNDSGISHLAAVVGIPTIAIFGPTDPENWAPLGDVIVLRGCTHHTTTQGQIRVCDDPTCLEAVSVDEVLEVLR